MYIPSTMVLEIKNFSENFFFENKNTPTKLVWYNCVIRTMCQQVTSPTRFIGRKYWTCVRLVWSTHYGNAGCEEFRNGYKIGNILA